MSDPFPAATPETPNTYIAATQHGESSTPHPAPQHDWEVLSMSTMSASTLGFHSRADEKPLENSFLPPDLQRSRVQGFGISTPLVPQSDDPQFASEPITGSVRCDIQELCPEGWRPQQFSANPFRLQDSLYSEDACPSEKEQAIKQEFNVSSTEGVGLSPLLPGDSDRDLESGALNAAEDSVCTPKKNAYKDSWWKRVTCPWEPKSGKLSSVWSIAIVAAFVGIVVIGWQRERYRNQQLKLELSAKDEKMNDLMNQVNRMMTGRRKPRSSFF